MVDDNKQMTLPLRPHSFLFLYQDEQEHSFFEEKESIFCYSCHVITSATSEKEEL
jgi:hypothetical protein